MKANQPRAEGSNQKSVLFIAWYFPPLGGVAPIRSLKNAQHLSEMGYKVTILTIRSAFVLYPKDRSMLGDLPAEVRIERCFCPDPNWLFKVLYGLKLTAVVRFLRHHVFIPDPEKFWLPFAKRRLRKLNSAGRRFDVAVISAGPVSSLNLGPFLRSRYSIPFICDFRDEWTNNPERLNVYFPEKTQRIEENMEARILAACSGVSYLTPIMRENFESRHASLRAKPSTIMPNGYNEAEFTWLVSTNNSDAFHLVYCGSFYDRRQPDPLWRAIAELIAEGMLNAEELRVDIIGRNTPAFVLGKYAGERRVSDLVRFHGFMSHRESLTEMMKADALLLYIPSGKNAESVLTGKIFDYLRSGKPILAIAPPAGLAAEIVLKAGTGFVAEHTDLPGIKDRLLDLVTLWRTGQLGSIQVDQDYVSEFSRRKLAARLAQLIDQVTGQATSPDKINNDSAPAHS